ncbi:MAG: ATP-binding protein [Coprothermobacterota bacterium]|nr:ATP-binding protein [Coprothermobacterota bacterium]
MNNFLDAQKLDSESIQLSEKPLEIKPLILETQELLKPYAVLNEVSFHNDFQEDLPPVPGDHERLVEVFTNLYSNAIRFSPKRGTIATSIRKKAQFLEIEITDQGPGIPKEELPHLFERFYRPQSPKLKPLAGTGLGLYLSRLIVEKHGGTIVVESEEEQGTRVIFSLPLQQT